MWEEEEPKNMGADTYTESITKLTFELIASRPSAATASGLVYKWLTDNV